MFIAMNRINLISVFIILVAFFLGINSNHFFAKLNDPNLNQKTKPTVITPKPPFFDDSITKNIFENPTDFLLILVDDLGFNDWFTYNTSNLKKLGNEGTVFTRMYHPESMCTPNRAALITGKYPVRIGMASPIISFRILTSPYNPGGLPLSETTIASYLSRVNYSRALFGKSHWGIGESCKYCPTNHGFDTYYGMPLTNIAICGDEDIFAHREDHFKDIKFFSTQYLDKGHNFTFARILLASIIMIFSMHPFLKLTGLANLVVIRWLLSCRIFNKTFAILTLVTIVVWHYYYAKNFFLMNKNNCLLYNGTKIVERPVNLDTLTFRLKNAAVDYIDNSDVTKPLFVMYAPDKMHTAIKTHPDFKNCSGKGIFADAMEELDASIGEIWLAYKKRYQKQPQHLKRNLVIIALSDNGPHREELESSGNSKPLRGGKGQAFDGGIRTKALFHISAGDKVIKTPKNIDTRVSTMDILPTILKMAHYKENLDSNNLDGQNMLSLLFSNNSNDSNDSNWMNYFNERPLFHYCGTHLHAMTYRDLKIHYEMAITEDPLRETCPDSKLCPCIGVKYDPPLIFNITEDIHENEPIKISTLLLDNIDDLKNDHINNIKYFPCVIDSFTLPYLKIES